MNQRPGEDQRSKRVARPVGELDRLRHMLFDRLFEASLLGVVYSRYSGEIVGANDAFLKMVGRTRAELERGELLWPQLTPPEFRDLDQMAIRSLREKGFSPAFEKEYLRTDGRRVPVLLMATAVGAGYEFDAVSLILDMTEKRQAEAERDRSESRFRTLFRQFPVPLIICGNDGHVRDCNSAWLKLFDVQREDVEGYNVLTDSQLGDLGLTDLIRRAFQGEAAYHAPFLYDPARIGRRGRPRWIEVHIYPVKGPKGEVCEVAFLEQDVTNQIQALESLRASEEHLRFLADATPALVWTSTADGRKNYFNQAWRDFTGPGFDPKTNPDWSELLHPEDRERVTQALLDASARSGVCEQEFRLRRADGQYRWFFDRAVPRPDSAGGFSGFIGIAVDITERKRAEQVLIENENRSRFLAEAGAVLTATLEDRKILEAVAHLAVPRIADWAILQIPEKGFLRSLAVAHSDPEKVNWAKELCERHPLPVDSPHGAAVVLRSGLATWSPQVTEAFLRQWAHDDKYLEAVRAAGIASYICVPLRARGQILGTITFLTERSTHRVFSENDLKFARDFADRAALAADNARLYSDSLAVNRIKDEFLATLSHELRTPLNVILGHAELLREDAQSLPPDVYDSIDAIHRNAKIQTQIISDLLDVSAIVTGKMAFYPIIIQPAKIVEAAAAQIQTAAAMKGVDLHIDLLDAPAIMLADPVRLQQILWNLLSNAVKFTPRDGRIRVRLFRHDGQCHFVIEDTGRGIDSEFLPYVFDRFRQENSGMNREYGGLGLGLAIVRHLAELHGGSVRVESDGRGRGATFTLSLPLKTTREALQTKERMVRDFSALGVGGKPLTGKHVLVIDDQEDNRVLVMKFLEKAGALVTPAASGREALTLLEGRTFDAIVSDIGMPEMDGFEFMREWRKAGVNRPFIPAAALTAYAREEEKRLALQAGFQIHIAKPVNPKELIDSVVRLFGH